jgi:hypothetical protein
VDRSPSGITQLPTPPDPSAGPGRAVAVAAAVLLIGAGALIGVLLVQSRSSTVAPAALPSGWTREAGPGFTLGLPPGWKSFPTTMDSKAFADLEKSDPARAAIVRSAFGGRVSPYIKFIAFDLGTPLSQTFTTNMNVIAVAAPRGLDAFVDNDVGQVRSAEGVASTVQTQRVTLPVGEAAIVTAQLRLPGNPQLAAVTHYALVTGKTGIILQFTTLADRLSDLARKFEEIARTFRFP